VPWQSQPLYGQSVIAAIERIRTYAGNPAAFATVTELEQYFRTVYKPYGYLPDAQWRLLTESSTRRLPDGRVTPHYDPAMVQQFIHHPQDYDLWPVYDRLDIPVLCLRGAESDSAAGRHRRSDARSWSARAGGDHRRLWPCTRPECA